MRIERAVRSAGLAERLDRARRSNVAPTTYKSERPEAERLTLDSGVEPSFSREIVFLAWRWSYGQSSLKI